MRDRRLSSWVILVSIAISIILVRVPMADAATFNLKYSNFFPPQHVMSKMVEEWGKEVEKRTKGTVKVNVFSGGTLTPPQQVFDGVVSGISDVGVSVFGYTPGRFPVMEGFDLPLGYHHAIQGTKIINDFYKKLKPKELSGVNVCYLFTGGPSIIHTKSPIQNLEDLKGKKIRSTGNSQGLIKALGGVPVALPQGEVYDALSKGLIEGNLVAMEALYTFKQYEVLKYTTMHLKTGWATGFYVVMNLKTWNSFPEDIKKTITDLNEEWALKTGKAWGDADTSAQVELEKLGHKFITLSDAEQAKWVNAAQAVFQQYIEYANKKGADGGKIIEEVKRLTDTYTK